MTTIDTPTAQQLMDAAILRSVKWFFEDFEDPCESTPYNSEEGGYMGDLRETREIVDELLTQLLPDELLEAATEDALHVIGGLGCGDICVPIGSNSSPE